MKTNDVQNKDVQYLQGNPDPCDEQDQLEEKKKKDSIFKCFMKNLISVLVPLILVVVIFFVIVNVMNYFGWLTTTAPNWVYKFIFIGSIPTIS